MLNEKIKKSTSIDVLSLGCTLSGSIWLITSTVVVKLANIAIERKAAWWTGAVSRKFILFAGESRARHHRVIVPFHLHQWSIVWLLAQRRAEGVEGWAWSSRSKWWSVDDYIALDVLTFRRCWVQCWQKDVSSKFKTEWWLNCGRIVRVCRLPCRRKEAGAVFVYQDSNCVNVWQDIPQLLHIQTGKRKGFRPLRGMVLYLLMQTKCTSFYTA